jgi:hypothetical protein
MRWLATLALALLLAGCAVVGPVGGPVAGGAVPGVAGAAPFPECMVDEFAFVGETTLAAIGLDQFAGPQEANRVAMIWVTAGPADGVPAPMPLPADGKGVAEPGGRVLCVQWPDGSGMSGPVDASWQPPSTQTASVDEPAPIPLGVLALLVGGALLVGVSFLAFRSEPARTG